MSKSYVFDWSMGVLVFAVVQFLPNKIFNKLFVGISRQEISITNGIIIFSGYALGFFYKFSEIYYIHITIVAFAYIWFSFKDRGFAILFANFSVQSILSAKQDFFPASYITLSFGKFIAAVLFFTIAISYWKRTICNHKS